MELIDKQKLLDYHRERIEHWKQFRKEFKDGSYSLNEACEIRIDTHQVAINMIESGTFDDHSTQEEIAKLKKERNELRPALQWFAKEMEMTLRKNEHKGSWKGETFQYLYSRLREEVQELWVEYNQQTPNWNGIISEASDIANFAMMIADISSSIIAKIEWNEDAEQEAEKQIRNCEEPVIISKIEGSKPNE